MTKPKKLDEIDGPDPNYNAIYEGLLEIANAITQLTEIITKIYEVDLADERESEALLQHMLSKKAKTT